MAHDHSATASPAPDATTTARPMNIGVAQEMIADAFPDRDAIVQGDRHISYPKLTERTRRLANFLLSRGLTVRTERPELEGWESGQDHLAICMLNSPEYLETLLGAYKARVMPFNVNYRYTGEELLYLFRDARPKAIFYQARFGPLMAEILPELDFVELLVCVDDGTGTAAVPGALDYETVLAESSADAPAVEVSSDDLYCMFTGGTTGMPKGVLWRQADCIAANLDGRRRDGSPMQDPAELVVRARRRSHKVVLPAPPFMHGAGCQTALSAFCTGNTVVIPEITDHVDHNDVVRTIQRHQVNMMLIIGDAFGRPLLAAARAHGQPLDSITAIYNSGAMLSPDVKSGLLEMMPNAQLIDALGASETGPQAMQVSKAGQTDIAETEARFRLSGDAAVLSADMKGELEPGHEGFGWLAKRGTVPLGYLGDPEKTAKTFPMIGDVRLVVPGDRVRLLADGVLEFHGRESFTINSGGEKIFAEEVERALRHHPAVDDVVVAGRPSSQWGQEVVAIIQTALPDDAAHQSGLPQALLAEAGRHIARYKLPKAFLFVDLVQRTPSGKTDIVWARKMVGGAR